jgi:hypothetical protein
MTLLAVRVLRPAAIAIADDVALVIVGGSRRI